MVVVDRKKVKGLKRDENNNRAFWTPNVIPATAIIAIVKPDDSQYGKANLNKLAKQVGLFDSEGNVIITNHGESPKRDKSWRHHRLSHGRQAAKPEQLLVNQRELEISWGWLQEMGVDWPV